MATTIIKSASSDNQALVDATGHLLVTSGGGGATLDANIATIGGAPITEGQKPMATSFPVVIASDQSTISTTNASVGVDGSPAPASSTQVGGTDPSLNLVALRTDASRNLFVTFEGVVVSVTATLPLASSGGITPNISIQLATSTEDGYLSQADWNTFNNKQSTAFTPSVPGNWPTPPTTIQQALDELAENSSVLLTSNPGPPGLAAALMIVPGLLATDTILAITQKTPGTVPTSVMNGYNSQINGSIIITYTADPGGGQVVTLHVSH